MLKGKQKNIDVAAPFGKITGSDFKKLGDGDKVVSKMYGGKVMKKMYGGKMMKLAGGGMMPQVRRKKGKKVYTPVSHMKNVLRGIPIIGAFDGNKIVSDIYKKFKKDYCRLLLINKKLT